MLQIFNKKMSKAKPVMLIGLVTQDAAMGAKLREAVSRRDGAELRIIESSSVTAAAQPAGVSVFAYHIEIANEASVIEFDRFMTHRPKDVPVIVLSPRLDEELVRWFLRLRVSDWLKLPLAGGELAAACARSLSAHNTRKQDVTCLTFMGARGGVGATTLALHAAMHFAAKAHDGKKPCLIDLDLVAGACADYLDLPAAWQIDELIANPSRLDGHMLDSMVSRGSTGVAVLAAQRNYLVANDFPEETVTRALDLAAQQFGSLIIDLPRRPEPWMDGVIMGSSTVYVVTEFTIPGLKAARRLCNDMLQRFDGEVKPRVIVNKYARSFFGSSISTKEVKGLLGDSLAGYVSSEPKLVREAIDRGLPTTAIKRRNAIVRDLARILDA